MDGFRIFDKKFEYLLMIVCTQQNFNESLIEVYTAFIHGFVNLASDRYICYMYILSLLIATFNDYFSIF